jgi:hypothetical protein
MVPEPRHRHQNLTARAAWHWNIIALVPLV